MATSSSTCDNNLYLSWLKQTYPGALNEAFVKTLADADRSNKKLWKAMNFDEIQKVK